MIDRLRKLLGKDHSAHIIAPDEQLKNVEQNIRAMTSVIEASKTNRPKLQRLGGNGQLTGAEINVERIHRGEYQPNLEHLEQSMGSYHDMDVELRLQLAGKISRLVPSLAESKKTLLLEHAVKVLTTMAKDQHERVRQILAQELADTPHAPYNVIKKLAWDPSPDIACHILEFSPLLQDADLIEILQTSDIPGVAEAVACRSNVSEAVSHEVVIREEVAAIQLLLENEGAHIASNDMDTIIEMAPSHEMWHEALAHRPELTNRTANRIAQFISQDILMKLEDSGELSSYHKNQTRARVTHRLRSWTADQEREAELQVKYLWERDRLDNEVIENAIDAINTPFVISALALRGAMDRDRVKRALYSDSAKVITSLAWHCGLSARVATRLQMKIGNINHTKLIHARGGKEYRLSADEMETFLEIYQ